MNAIVDMPCPVYSSFNERHRLVEAIRSAVKYAWEGKSVLLVLHSASRDEVSDLLLSHATSFTKKERDAFTGQKEKAAIEGALTMLNERVHLVSPWADWTFDNFMDAVYRANDGWAVANRGIHFDRLVTNCVTWGKMAQTLSTKE